MTNATTCPLCKSPLEHHEPDPNRGVIGMLICTREDCDHGQPAHEDCVSDHGFLGL